MGWKLDDIIRENVKKLNERYPNGFTQKQAARKNTRIDWCEKE